MHKHIGTDYIQIKTVKAHSQAKYQMVVVIIADVLLMLTCVS